MFYAVQLLYFIIPAVFVQYVLALFCLYKLVMLELPKRRFWIWNFFVLLGIGVGFITFFICYYGFREKVFGKADKDI